MHQLNVAHHSVLPLQKAPGEPSLPQVWEPQPLSGAPTKGYGHTQQGDNLEQERDLSGLNHLLENPGSLSCIAERQIPQTRWCQYLLTDSFLIFFLVSTASAVIDLQELQANSRLPCIYPCCTTNGNDPAVL